jgi:SAM-dependent methyltransferase
VKGASAKSLTKDAFETAVRLVVANRDVLDERATDERAPAWCTQRGWSAALLALDDEALGVCERGGAAALADNPSLPSDLRALGRAIEAAITLPSLPDAAPLDPASELVRRANDRKRAQLAQLLAAIAPLAQKAKRIVDVGAGSGHLTRLASLLFEREALGIERNETRVVRAQEVAQNLAPSARFEARDAFTSSLDLQPTDLAMGLHACGELGDRLITSAAEARASVVLVSCCLQKIAAPSRAPLNVGIDLDLPREVLGLANLTPRDEGVETSLEATLEARRARVALQLLLRARGVEVSTGEAMRGINRRVARHGLRALAGPAFALRELSPATETELAHADDRARVEFAAARRLSLPRNALARVVEVAVVLDRARYLEERGFETTVAIAFPAEVSPRNLVLIAQPT